MKQYAEKHYKLTSKTAQPRQVFLIEGTKHKIAVPYSIQTNPWDANGFEFLGYRLHVLVPALKTRPGVVNVVGRPLPESWFVDLSGDVDPDPETGSNATLLEAAQSLGKLQIIHIGN